MNNQTGTNNINQGVLPGVNCDATDCVHHDGICNCTAKYINVKIKNSLLGSSVACETFQQK